MKLNELTAKEIREKIVSKEVTIKAVLDDFYAAIEKNDSVTNAYVSLCKDKAYKKAEALQELVDSDKAKGQLFGVPVAIKDNLVVKGEKTTCSSNMLKDFVPPYTAEVINRLEDAGAIILGKTNMDEFAMGSSTENSAMATTKNPWNAECAPGGSSGGSAASVADKTSALSVGSDTGGSIRQPASFCGVVGVKPTYGMVSRYGLIAFASSLDQIGPFATNVYDAAMMLNVLSGHDDKDSTSLKEEVPDYTKNLNDSIEGKVIGVPKEYFGEGIEDDVRDAVNQAIEVYKSKGAVIKEISLPHTKYSIAVYYIIATAEASSNLGRYDGVSFGHRAENYDGLIDMYKKSRTEGFGEEVKRRIMLGTYVLSSGYYDAYYLKAQKVRTLITKDFVNAFSECDVILTPTSPSQAFKIGERSDDPLSMYLSDIFTTSANLAGIPGVSVPCGFSKDNLPVGLQLLGKHCDEATMLNFAHVYEQENKFYEKRP